MFSAWQMLLHQFRVPGLAGRVAALDGAVEKGVLGVQGGELFGHGSQGQGVARAVGDLADGGVDLAALALGGLEGNPLGEEGALAQRREGFEDGRIDGLDAVVAVLGFGVDGHGYLAGKGARRRPLERE